ncbi:glycosyltransferase [uncultured Tenacibaculum sp.]|uniref:glycosyltransferase n=1 Tax=uncultured Tenacibaculum sp. TaxID=174713 RepID=UPI002603EDF0|nr:glycosyltransferase [uncultured Tenacibaculum sp.]
MRIIHVVPYIGDKASGPAYSVPALCNALQQSGCDVTLYTLAPLNVSEENFLFKVKTFKRDKYPSHSFGASKEMFKALLKESKNVDLIHMHSLWMAQNIYVGKVARKFKIPLVTSPRGTLSKEALKRSRWKKEIVLALGQRRALRYSKYYHATAIHEYEDINDYVSDKKTTIIPNGVDIPNLIDKVKANKSEDRSRRKLLFLARIHPIKGLENLIDAWLNLEQEFKDWDLEIVGVGDENYVSSLKNRVKEKGIERIYFLDPVFGESKNVKFQESELYILPSFSENFGMTVAEALSNGVPTITTDGTPWEEIDKKDCGWYIQPNRNSIEETLREALSLSPKELSLKGQKGRNWMIHDYSWRSLALQLVDFYKEILNENLKK